MILLPPILWHTGFVFRRVARRMRILVMDARYWFLRVTGLGRRRRCRYLATVLALLRELGRNGQLSLDRLDGLQQVCGNDPCTPPFIEWLEASNTAEVLYQKNLVILLDRDKLARMIRKTEREYTERCGRVWWPPW